jgi:hypothetical protein
MLQENELVGRAIGQLGDLGPALHKQLSAAERAEIKSALAEFLCSQSDHVTISQRELPGQGDLKSMLYRSAGPRTDTVVCFAFRDAATETMFPLLGIILTIYSGKWGLTTIPQAAGVLKTIWSKLVVLRRPADAGAIDVLKAIARSRAKHIVSGSDDHPTTGEIEIDSGLSNDAVVAALRTLRSRSVIEIDKWDAQTDDMDQPHNRWRIKL